MPKAAPIANRVGSPAEGRELRARGQRTVRKLLDAGIEVFGTKGYHAARVDDIVKVGEDVARHLLPVLRRTRKTCSARS